MGDPSFQKDMDRNPTRAPGIRGRINLTFSPETRQLLDRTYECALAVLCAAGSVQFRFDFLHVGSGNGTKFPHKLNQILITDHHSRRSTAVFGELAVR